MIQDYNRESLILIGEIVSPVGIKGEVKVKVHSSDPQRFHRLDFVFCEYPDGKIEKAEIERSGIKGNMAVVKLSTVKDRNDAEAMRGVSLLIEEDQLEELPEDTYYLRDLIGLNVVDDATEEPVGVIKDVIQNTAQDIYVIEHKSGSDVLVPAVKEFIKEVNIASGYVKISFIEGMLPE